MFGTDYLGQDVLSRLMYGGTEILLIAVLGTLLGMVVGILIGVVAAYGGGWWDEVIMRLNDVLLAFPQILLALVVLTARRPAQGLDDRRAGRRLARPPRRPARPRRRARASSRATSCTPPRRSARSAPG